jgi:hypothetical protein
MFRLLALAAVCAIALAGCDCDQDITSLFKANAALEKRIDQLEQKLANGTCL